MWLAVARLIVSTSAEASPCRPADVAYVALCKPRVGSGRAGATALVQGSSGGMTRIEPVVVVETPFSLA